MDEIPKVLVGAFAMNTPSLAVPQVVEHSSRRARRCMGLFLPDDSAEPLVLEEKKAKWRKVAEEVCGASVERLFAGEEPVSRHEETLSFFLCGVCPAVEPTSRRLGVAGTPSVLVLGSVVKPVEVVGSTDHDMLLRGLKRAIRRLIKATQNCPGLRSKCGETHGSTRVMP